MTEIHGEGELSARLEEQVKTPEERLEADPGLEPELAHERDEQFAERNLRRTEEQPETD